MIQCQQCGKSGFQNKGNLSSHLKWCGVPFDAEGFWNRMQPLPWSGCWIWIGPKYSTGYGCVEWSPVRGRPSKLIGAHRLAWMLSRSPIPDGMEVLHSCDEPFCCNPGHLRLGTHAENMADCHAKDRHARGDRGRSKLTEAQAKEILALKGTGPAKPIADRYGVGPGAVSAIWRGSYWKHIQVAPLP